MLACSHNSHELAAGVAVSLQCSPLVHSEVLTSERYHVCLLYGVSSQVVTVVQIIPLIVLFFSAATPASSCKHWL
jgi:hypothetical protein